MNKPNMTCKVCGKKYFCCGDSKKLGSWRAVTCSPGCYQEYMKRIEESRKPVVLPHEQVSLEEHVEKPVRNRSKSKSQTLTDS